MQATRGGTDHSSHPALPPPIQASASTPIRWRPAACSRQPRQHRPLRVLRSHTQVPWWAHVSGCLGRCLGGTCERPRFLPEVHCPPGQAKCSSWHPRCRGVTVPEGGQNAGSQGVLSCPGVRERGFGAVGLWPAVVAIVWCGAEVLESSRVCVPRGCRQRVGLACGSGVVA